MKTKRIKGLQVGSCVKCSFCKEKKATRQFVGFPYGGRTVCKDCLKGIVVVNIDCDDLSLGEEQAYSMYKVF